MVIYDEETGRLFIPGRGDKIYVSIEEIYEEAFNKAYTEGFQSGYTAAEEDCKNN